MRLPCLPKKPLLFVKASPPSATNLAWDLAVSCVLTSYPFLGWSSLEVFVRVRTKQAFSCLFVRKHGPCSHWVQISEARALAERGWRESCGYCHVGLQRRRLCGRQPLACQDSVNGSVRPRESGLSRGCK